MFRNPRRTLAGVSRPRRCGPFPWPAQIGDEGSGQPKLGVRGDDQPGPAVAGNGAPRGAPSVSSNNASARAVSESYNSRRNPARSPRPVEVSSAPAVRAGVTLGIAATAFVFELCERNPKRIKRWPFHVPQTHRKSRRRPPLQHRQVTDQAWSTQRIAQVRGAQFTPAGHASWCRPPDCSVFQRRWHRRQSANLGTLILSPDGTLTRRNPRFAVADPAHGVRAGGSARTCRTAAG